jgi:hypothetical protein
LPQSEIGNLQLQGPTEVLKAIQTFFDYVKACGVAEPDCAIVSEGRSGNNCDVCFAQ